MSLRWALLLPGPVGFWADRHLRTAGRIIRAEVARASRRHLCGVARLRHARPRS
jgi:hypothetical protein